MKLVDFASRIPEEFSFHFYDFSMNFYTFSKFAVLSSIVFMPFFTLAPGSFITFKWRSLAEMLRTEQRRRPCFRQGKSPAVRVKWGKGWGARVLPSGGLGARGGGREGIRRREVDLRRGRRAERSGQAAVEAGLLGCTKWPGHHLGCENLCTTDWEGREDDLLAVQRLMQNCWRWANLFFFFHACCAWLLTGCRLHLSCRSFFFFFFFFWWLTETEINLFLQMYITDLFFFHQTSTPEWWRCLLWKTW